MANNLRKFATVSAYQAAELIKPAVSLIEENDDVYFDQKEVVQTFGGLTVKYNIINTTSEMTLFNGGGGSSSSSESSSESGGGGALPTRMIVDGVEETPINTWRFVTAGEHIVQYEFEDNAVPEAFMFYISYATEIIIGDDITTIPDGTANGNVFGDMPDLTSVTIGSGVTYIGVDAFRNSTVLTSVTVNATTPPTLGSNVFDNTNNSPIYVPASAVEEYQTSTSTGWSTYASRIEAIQ